MNYNIFLLRLGFDPSQFVNHLNEPIKIDDGWLYEVEQINPVRQCPHCKHHVLYIYSRRQVDFNCRETQHINDVLRVWRIRLRCSKCRKTFTPPLRGVDPGNTTSQQTLQLIYSDFTSDMTFAAIGKRYGITTARVMQIFDEKIKFVPRCPLPEVLCIDEIKFQISSASKYICILYDFYRKEIVDIVRNRQIPYLRDYFSEINPIERGKVKFVISDMYDAYSTISHTYFKNATHIVDTFHVIRLLTTVINQICVRTMHLNAIKGSPEYNFMKKNWKLFLCRLHLIHDRYYTYQKTGQMFHYDELLKRCIRLNSSLWSAHNTLQDLLNYQTKYTFDEALKFVERISNILQNCDSPLIKEVGRSYYKWRIEIANAFSKTQNNIRYHNGVAETINNHIKSITKAAHCYRNFERFRKRAMLILTYAKPHKEKT